MRLTGKAQTAFLQFPEIVRNKYSVSMKALNTRFNPDSKQELYVAELQSRKRRKEEDCTSFGDVLKLLAGKAYADLKEKARERLALNQFLAEIVNPQVAFGVKQKRPKTVEAVIATIELELYLGSAATLSVNITIPQIDIEHISASVSSVTSRADSSRERGESMDGTLKALNERLHRLELRMESGREVEQRRKQGATICWTCGRKGHIACFCQSHGEEQQQENSSTSVVRASHLRDNA